MITDGTLDTYVWNLHHEFCRKEGSFKVLVESLARFGRVTFIILVLILLAFSAIEANPYFPHFWIESAKFEYERNKNITYARGMYDFCCFIYVLYSIIATGFAS